MTRYRIPEGVLEADLDDGRVLLNERTGVYHHLNRSGTRVVELLTEGQTLDSIVETLSREQGEALERVRADVVGFVAALRDRDLIEQEDHPT